MAERTRRQQPLHLPLPGVCLTLHDTERGELLPQARLEPADPQRVAGGGLLQRPRFLDQRGQRPQFRLLQREVRAVGEQEMCLAAGSVRGTRRVNGTVRPSALMVIPRSNQSVSPATFAGGHADGQRVAHLAVVDLLTAALDLYLVKPAQQRQHLRGEPHRVGTGEVCAFGPRHVLFDRRQHGAFGVWVAIATVIRIRPTARAVWSRRPGTPIPSRCPSCARRRAPHASRGWDRRSPAE